jgi:hypothetical protein
MAEPRTVKMHPDVITVDLTIQQRVNGMDAGRVDELYEILKDGRHFQDKPVVFKSADGPCLLAGGFHRHAAAKRHGKSIQYEVRDGEWIDALKYALADNADHLGVPRTSEDKRKAVHTALNHPDLKKLPDREIDRMCRVAIGYASRLRKELTGAAPDPVKSAAAIAGNQAKNANRGAGIPHPADGRGGHDVPGEGAGARPGTDAPRPAPDGYRADPGHSAPRGPHGRDSDEEGEEAQAQGQPVPGADGATAGGGPKVERRAGDPQAGPVLARDRLGRILPPHLAPAFESGKALEDAVKKIRSAKGKATHAAGTGVLGDFLKNPLIRLGLDDAAAGLSAALPYCVCPACVGADKHCPTCGGCGWLTRHQHGHLDAAMQEEAARYAPGDAWEGDDAPAPVGGPAPAFVPPGPGLDALGNSVPKRLRDVFADEFLSHAAAQCDRLAAALKSSSSWCPWLKPTVWESLTAAAHQVRDSRPYAVCGCKGAGCEACLTGGFLPAFMAPELKVA